MPVEFPMILVAKKEFLESFQNGNLYMVNSLYYQQMENDDPNRGDKYDGAIKCSIDGYYIIEKPLNDVTEIKLMGLASYIKCFFHFKNSDIVYMSNNTYRLSLSKESANEFANFDEEYALMIYDVPKFIERFRKACENNRKIANYFYADVIYIDDDKYPKYQKEIIEGALGRKTEGVTNPSFIKRKKYSAQQEFRIVVSLELGKPTANAIGFKLPESIGFSMDSIRDISSIVHLKDIVDKSIFAIITPDLKGDRIEYYL